MLPLWKPRRPKGNSNEDYKTQFLARCDHLYSFSHNDQYWLLALARHPPPVGKCFSGVFPPGMGSCPHLFWGGGARWCCSVILSGIGIGSKPCVDVASMRCPTKCAQIALLIASCGLLLSPPMLLE